MNQRGFITIFSLALLPVVLTAIFLMASAYLILRSDAAARHVCRVELLKAQEGAARTLEQLLALNKAAALLRAQRNVAEAVVKGTTALPPARTAAMATLEVTKMQQRALGALQKRLLAKGRSYSRIGPIRTRAEVASRLEALALHQADGDRSLSYRARTEAAAFDLVASPKDSPTPDYEPSPFFERRQTMRVTWSFEVHSLLPPWLRKIAPNPELRSAGECAATLRKGDQKWHPVLSADKS